MSTLEAQMWKETINSEKIHPKQSYLRDDKLAT